MAEPRDKRASAFRQVPGLAPMLLASLLSRTGATMVGLSMGFVAYEQTTSRSRSRSSPPRSASRSRGPASSPDSHRHHVLSLYIFVTAVATPVGALLWGAVADLLFIDASLGGAGVLLVFGVGAALLIVLRREARECRESIEALPQASPVPQGSTR
ncbi:MAG TPA: hypothetical protein VKH36_07815 [Acidimicrobiia bacterium]|nr:hypothetical protein [Acidimicrobiia bacterium]